jgi:hypothetical protein
MLARSVLTCFFLLLPALAWAQEPTLEERALIQLNLSRRHAGLEPVTLDSELSRGCMAHAAYLVRNTKHPSTQGLGAHDEDPQLPGYTEDGKKAAKSSDISFGHPPLAAIDCWMNSLFHRIPIIDPNLKKVGFGYAQGGRWRNITVLDVERGRDKGRTETVVIFPGKDMKQVPLALQRGETPDPIPEDKDKLAGYPITITFPLGAMVREAAATLTLDGKEVEVWLSTPEKPVDARFQRNTICLIAKHPFRPGATYTVAWKATVNGMAMEQTWSFGTATTTR